MPEPGGSLTAFECPVCGDEPAERFAAPHGSAAKCRNGLCGHLFILDPKPDQGLQEIAEPGREAETFRARNEALGF